MAQTATFSSILDETSSGTVDRPKPLPVGTYTCIVVGQPRFDKSSKLGTPFVEFTLKPIQAGEDVDEDALEEIGGIGNRTLRATFYLTEEAKYRLDKFLEDLGILEEGKTRSQMISETPNSQVLVSVKRSEERRVGKECRSRWST